MSVENLAKPHMRCECCQCHRPFNTARLDEPKFELSNDVKSKMQDAMQGTEKQCSLDTEARIKELERLLECKTEQEAEIRKLYELLIKECYSLDKEIEDDGEYRYKWAYLAIDSTKRKLSKQEAKLKIAVDYLEFLQNYGQEYGNSYVEDKVREALKKIGEV
jgi:hypothetical protein